MLITLAYLFAMVAYLVLRLLFGGTFWWLALLNTFAIHTFVPAFVLLPITAALRLWRDVIRLGLVALLGIIWFGPFFQPVSAPQPTGNPQLTVVTFNMRHKQNGNLDTVIDWLAQSESDIVLLQEVPEIYSDGIDALREIYPYQQLFPKTRLTLSRYPFVDTTERYVVIEVQGQEVAVYNVHFTMPVRWEGRFGIRPSTPIIGIAVNYDETQRNADIRALLNMLEDQPLPHIVGGDFNLSQHSIIYSDLALVLTDSYRRTSSGLGATWPSNFPMLRIDYIWHNPGLRSLMAEVGPDLASDHLPVIATLEVVLPPGASEVPTE
ncbi:MAG: endonuclease/exonuclease/phosphatase family protein [Chloroflexota bacterium]